MNEQLGGEKEPSPESLEEQKYREWQAAVEEEERIRQEIEKVFEETPDRAEAEQKVLVELAPLMDDAMKKSAELFQEWWAAVRQSREADEDQ